MGINKKNPGYRHPTTNFTDDLAKMSVKERGKALADGDMPDGWDRKNIDAALNLYDRTHPGQIAKLANDVYAEVQASTMGKNAELGKTGVLRKGFWLPNDFQSWMELAYPSFWINKKHAEWFMKNFPVFSYANYSRRAKT